MHQRSAVIGNYLSVQTSPSLYYDGSSLIMFMWADINIRRNIDRQMLKEISPQWSLIASNSLQISTTSQQIEEHKPHNMRMDYQMLHYHPIQDMSISTNWTFQTYSPNTWRSIFTYILFQNLPLTFVLFMVSVHFAILTQNDITICPVWHFSLKIKKHKSVGPVSTRQYGSPYSWT